MLLEKEKKRLMDDGHKIRTTKNINIKKNKNKTNNNQKLKERRRIRANFGQHTDE